MVLSRQLPLTYLYQSWVWKKAEQTSLARFVSEPCAASVVETIDLPDGRSLLDAIEADDRAAVASAVYQQIAQLNIDYDTAGYTAEGANSQRIRSPVEIVGRKRATCLDLALWYAGLALHAGLQPIVVVLQGHALVAIVNVRYRLEIDQSTDHQAIKDWLADDKLLPIECTGAAKGAGLDYSFDQAVDNGATTITNGSLLFAIDPARLQGEGGLEPKRCRSLSPLRLSAVAAAVALAVVGGVALRRATEVPVFASEVDGVAVAEIVDAEPLGGWLARSLSDAAERDQFVDVGECNVSVNEIEVWDPDTSSKASLQDPSNPSNIDVVLEGRTVGSGVGAMPLVELNVRPLSATVRSAADPVLLVDLPSMPALVDEQRTALDAFPELVTLPALITGMRELEAGDANRLARAECLFGVAERALTNQGDTPRTNRFLASVDLLKVNVAIHQASNAPADEEQAALVRAETALDQARVRLDDDDAAAILDANGIAIDMMTSITDGGRLVDGITRRDVEDRVEEYQRVADAARPLSDPAYVAVSTMAAQLALAGWRSLGDDGLLKKADELTALALAGQEEPVDPAVAPHLAAGYRTRALVHLGSGDPSAAVADYEAAAELTEHADHYRSLLAAAGARSARCQDDDAVRIAETFDEVGNYVAATGNTGLQRLLDDLRAANQCTV